MSVDGQAVSVWPEKTAACCCSTFPQAKHEVIVRFGSAGLRRLGTGLTAIGVTLSAGLLLVISRWRRHERGDAAKSGELTLVGLHRRLTGRRLRWLSLPLPCSWCVP